MRAIIRWLTGRDPYVYVAASLKHAVNQVAHRHDVGYEFAGDVSLASERSGIVEGIRHENLLTRLLFGWTNARMLARFDQFVAAYESAGAPYGMTIAGLLRWHDESV